MRKTTATVICDYCKQKIRGYPVKLIPRYADQERKNEFTSCQVNQGLRDYHEKCIKEIINFANNGND